MLLTEIIKTMATIKKGTFTKLCYKTEVPVKASCKDKIKIVKFNKTVARFGINYGNLASVKAKASNDEAPKKKSNPNKEWVLRNIIEYNKNTEKFYLNVYPATCRSNSVYVIYKDNKVITSNSLSPYKDMIQESYLNRKYNGVNEFYKVNIDNVISVGM